MINFNITRTSCNVQKGPSLPQVAKITVDNTESNAMVSYTLFTFNDVLFQLGHLAT